MRRTMCGHFVLEPREVGQADMFRDLTERIGGHQAHCRRSRMVSDRDGVESGSESVDKAHN